jgi:hypothetical protein
MEAHGQDTGLPPRLDDPRLVDLGAEPEVQEAA